jgi:SAM-dependent methyltransferase
MNHRAPTAGHSHAAHPALDPRIPFFDHHAPKWDADAGACAETTRRFQGLRSRLGLQAGLSVLEVGCGTGQITGLLATWVRPGRVTAVDFSPAMLAQARAKGLDADFLELDICAASAGTAAFDLALCFHSFPHFRDPVAALGLIARSLKPAGRLVILHLAGSEQINAFHRQAGAAVAADLLPARDGWPALLAPAGLRLEACEDQPDLLWVEARRIE